MFNNSNLNSDIEKILSFDLPITITKSFDSNLEYPFILDVVDTGYFYTGKKERDEDYKKIKSILKL